MPDLSDVLGDVYNGVYGGGSSAPQPRDPVEEQVHADVSDDSVSHEVPAANADVAGESEPPRRAGEAPEWADESRLDAAFATWRPGPDRNAPAAERKLFGDAALAPVAARDDDVIAVRPRPLDGDMAAALSEALAPSLSPPDFPPAPSLPARDRAPEPVLAAPFEPEPEPQPEPVLVAAGHGPWQRGDDDLLPGRRARFALRRR